MYDSLLFSLFEEKGGVQIPGSPPLLAERAGGCLWTPSSSEAFCPQHRSQKENTENQRHLVVTGVLSSHVCMYRDDRMLVSLEKGNSMISPQPGPWALFTRVSALLS